jgi:hypothetical protein
MFRKGFQKRNQGEGIGLIRRRRLKIKNKKWHLGKLF